MEAGEVYFTISERIYGVLHWFREALRPLTEARFKEDQAVKEDQSVRVALGYLHEMRPDEPGVFADLVIPAFRSTVTPPLPPELLELDMLPKGHKEQLVSLGPAIRFRFSVLDDETYVMASCAEFLPSRAKMAFGELLRKVKARYPETAPSLLSYEAERKERMKEDLRRQFGDVKAQSQRAEGTGAKARGKTGRPRIKANEWAWHEVNIVGKDPREVYPEWCKLYAAETGTRVSELSDSTDSFKKAIKPKPK